MEGNASFPDQSQYEILKNPWLKTLVLERRGREQRGREGRREESCCSVLALVKRQKKKKREGERVRGFLNTTTLNPKD